MLRSIQQRITPLAFSLRTSVVGARAFTAVPETIEDRRRRLLYRSKQRGWLELDLIMGRWVDRNLHKLDSQQLDEWEAIVDAENPDLMNIFIELKAPTPESGLVGNSLIPLLQEFTQSKAYIPTNGNQF